MSESTTNIVCLKAFGDLTIAVTSAQRAIASGRCGDVQIIAGRHLEALCTALQTSVPIRFVETGSQVPALFDLRHRGVLAGMQSLRALRATLSGWPDPTSLLFDRLGWRERLLTGQHRARALAPAENIYLAYGATLGIAVDAVTCRSDAPRRTGPIAILPASRLAWKMLPAHVIAWIHARCLEIECEVLLIEGESVDIPSGVPVRRIERSFVSLITALRGVRAVVGADSLPGHLCEFLGIPAFVVSPAPNTYWLPQSAFANKSWGTFACDAAMARRLESFIATQPIPSCQLA